MAAELHTMVHDLVLFLAKHDQDELKRLQAAYPGASEQAMLDPEEKMAPLSPIRKAKLHLAVASLQSFIRNWMRLSSQVDSTLDRANKWKFLGSVLAALGSGTALTLLLSQPDETVSAAFASAISLIGGLIGLTIKFLRRDVYGTNDALLASRLSLSSGAASASSLLRELTPHLIANDDGDDSSKMESTVGAANKLVADMDVVLASLPPDMRRAKSA